MTEQDWLESDDPGALIQALETCDVSDRKRRLFAVACCRKIMPLLKDDASRRAVEVAELHADGLASNAELAEAREAASIICRTRSKLVAPEAWHAGLMFGFPGWLAEQVANECATLALYNVGAGVTEVCSSPPLLEELISVGLEYPQLTANDVATCHAATIEWEIELLHEVFRNPYRPIPSDPAWLTATVVSLAQRVYEARAFDRLPVLADALEDAGCTNADILNHCREPGDHVRGCWALDLVLAKQ